MSPKELPDNNKYLTLRLKFFLGEYGSTQQQARHGAQYGWKSFFDNLEKVVAGLE